jgi:hypothetical protein
MNYQNNWYWNAENPTSVHTEEGGVWCTISVCTIIGPIFYDNTINAARYVNHILRPFLSDLTEEEERLRSVSQQDTQQLT